MSDSPHGQSIPAEDWAGEMGERWLKNLDRFESMIAPIGKALITRAAFRAGERVVDIGCGGGATTIEIARRVAPSGEALGLDISPSLVTAATRRAQAAGVGNVRFRCADAAVAALDGPPFDRLFSRFGVMFFEDAASAFANLRRLVQDGAAADFSVWAPARENAWIAELMQVAARYVELPTPVPRAPGPFALDDPDYLRDVLARVGFGAVRIDTWRGEQLVGGAGASAEEATDFILEAMSFGRLLADARPQTKDALKADVVALFSRHETAEGVPMPATAFLVRAVAASRSAAA